eukprot:gnl/TRDRNA2_/TRDRNA2_133688_c0_seq2.p2 gnl/TRDRNA2_/TRDRNA2_133688_c0~~gnl/TRDRNA2_/TRDRNA2_133688_c0_seq2.p2  ORF type:complete len:144 (+),score=24.79 gnl/TRDRNA2_/TRDRNA2_133688_c0_seq2:120-551(+)
MLRLMDNHDPRRPKHEKHVLFSYTCKDGSEVPADSFRISGITVILRAFHELRFWGPELEKCVNSMAEYVKRSVERSPQMMREAGDACGFFKQVAWIVRDGGADIGHLLTSKHFDLPRLLVGTPDRQVEQLRRELQRVGISLQL